MAGRGGGRRRGTPSVVSHARVPTSRPFATADYYYYHHASFSRPSVSVSYVSSVCLHLLLLLYDSARRSGHECPLFWRKYSTREYLELYIFCFVEKQSYNSSFDYYYFRRKKESSRFVKRMFHVYISQIWKIIYITGQFFTVGLTREEGGDITSGRAC